MRPRSNFERRDSRPSERSARPQSFGCARLESLVPPLPQDAPSGINMILSYEEAARLHASLGAILAHSAAGEIRPGNVNMVLWTDTQRLVIQMDRGFNSGGGGGFGGRSRRDDDGDGDGGSFESERRAPRPRSSAPRGAGGPPRAGRPPREGGSAPRGPRRSPFKRD